MSEVGQFRRANSVDVVFAREAWCKAVVYKMCIRDSSHAFHRPSFPRPFVAVDIAAQRFLLLSSVRRKRKDSVPVSMMWARSVIRSSSALQSRGFGNTVVHSENGKFVVTIMAARSALSEIT